jgi:hypothetical protein
MLVAVPSLLSLLGSDAEKLTGTPLADFFKEILVAGFGTCGKVQGQDMLCGVIPGIFGFDAFGNSLLMKIVAEPSGNAPYHLSQCRGWALCVGTSEEDTKFLQFLIVHAQILPLIIVGCGELNVNTL